MNQKNMYFLRGAFQFSSFIGYERWSGEYYTVAS